MKKINPDLMIKYYLWRRCEPLSDSNVWRKIWVTVREPVKSIVGFPRM